MTPITAAIGVVPGGGGGRWVRGCRWLVKCCSSQDRAFLQGWPRGVDFGGLTENQGFCLMGEAVHLGCFASVLMPLVYSITDPTLWTSPPTIEIEHMFPLRPSLAPSAASEGTDIARVVKRRRL